MNDFVDSIETLPLFVQVLVYAAGGTGAVVAIIALAWFIMMSGKQ
jgi:hypothetical protein